MSQPAFVQCACLGLAETGDVFGEADRFADSVEVVLAERRDRGGEVAWPEGVQEHRQATGDLVPGDRPGGCGHAREAAVPGDPAADGLFPVEWPGAITGRGLLAGFHRGGVVREQADELAGADAGTGPLG